MSEQTKAAKRAAAILRERSGKLAHYKIQEGHWDGVALIREDKDPNNGPPREILLATSDTLAVMHRHIIQQYGPPDAQRPATLSERISQLFRPRRAPA